MIPSTPLLPRFQEVSLLLDEQLDFGDVSLGDSDFDFGSPFARSPTRKSGVLTAQTLRMPMATVTSSTIPRTMGRNQTLDLDAYLPVELELEDEEEYGVLSDTPGPSTGGLRTMKRDGSETLLKEKALDRPKKSKSPIPSKDDLYSRRVSDSDRRSSFSRPNSPVISQPHTNVSDGLQATRRLSRSISSSSLAGPSRIHRPSSSQVRPLKGVDSGQVEEYKSRPTTLTPEVRKPATSGSSSGSALSRYLAKSAALKTLKPPPDSLTAVSIVSDDSAPGPSQQIQDAVPIAVVEILGVTRPSDSSKVVDACPNVSTSPDSPIDRTASEGPAATPQLQAHPLHPHNPGDVRSLLKPDSPSPVQTDRELFILSHDNTASPHTSGSLDLHPDTPHVAAVQLTQENIGSRRISTSEKVLGFLSGLVRRPITPSANEDRECSSNGSTRDQGEEDLLERPVEECSDLNLQANTAISLESDVSEFQAETAASTTPELSAPRLNPPKAKKDAFSLTKPRPFNASIRPALQPSRTVHASTSHPPPLPPVGAKINNPKPVMAKPSSTAAHPRPKPPSTFTAKALARLPPPGKGSTSASQPTQIQPRERATNIASRRAVFEPSHPVTKSDPKIFKSHQVKSLPPGYVPSGTRTIPIQGHTPGKAMRSRLEQRHKFDQSVKEKMEEEKRKREEEERVRVEREDEEYRVARGVSVVWAKGLPAMYREGREMERSDG